MDFLERVDRVLKRVSAGIALTKESNPSESLLELRELLTSMREELLSAKEAAIEAREENIRLRDKLAETERFDERRNEFERQTLKTGSVVYVERQENESKGAIAYLCPQCFERKHISYLQAPVKREFKRDLFSCSQCEYIAAVPNEIEPAAMVGKTNGGWGGI